METITKNKKICTIGGGSGMPIVNTALINAGFTNISSIVTTFDSGGDSGRMRTDERGHIMAFSDYWRSLISLWKSSEQKSDWEKMLRFRDGRGRNFGNIFFQFLSERSGCLDGGQVIPVANEPSSVCFRTLSGKEYVGEHMIDELRMSKDQISEIWLSPSVTANDKAIQALRESQIIIFCPGSIYGSLLVNLLVDGIGDCIKKSQAKKILMTNLMSTANESMGFDSESYVKLFEKYLGKEDVIDMVLMADLGVLDQEELTRLLNYYEMENSAPIIARTGVKNIYKEDIAIIETKNMRLRHSETKLSTIFSKLIQ